MNVVMSRMSARLRGDEKGATAVEYGIMVALIAVAVIAAVTLIGGNLTSTFNSVACSVKGGAYTAAVAGSGAPGDTGYVAASAASCSK